MSDTQEVVQTQTEEIRSAIELNNNGVMMPRTASEMMRIAQILVKSKMVPKHFDTPEKVFVALQFAAENGVKGISALRQIMIINGSPAFWGDMPLALAIRTGKLTSIEEVPLVGDKEEVLGYICTIKKEGLEVPVSRKFGQSDARKAGLWGKSGPWSLYPQRMLQLRARSWALKDSFPEIFLGAAIAEYDSDMSTEEIRNVSDAASKMNEAFS